MILARPLEELELTDECRPQPLAVRYLGFRQAGAPPTAFGSGSFANGEVLISNGRNRFISCARTRGVKPLRLRAT